jgi:hypothetical protein
VADEAYADGGTSLYDAVVLTSKDRATVDRYIDDGVASLMHALPDMATLSGTTLTITAPDIVSDNATQATNRISRYLALYAITEILQSRRAALVPRYAERVAAALDDVIALVRTRTAPTRS